MKSSLTLLCLISILTAGAYRSFEYRAAVMHSPQLMTFYSGVSEDLYYALYRNAETANDVQNYGVATLEHLFNWGGWCITGPKLSFTPLFFGTLSYKHHNHWYSEGLFSVQAVGFSTTRIGLGITPSIDFTSYFNPHRLFVSLRPSIGGTQSFLWGTLGDMAVTSLTSGVAVQLFVPHRLYLRGFSVEAGVRFEKVLTELEPYGLAYGESEPFIYERYQEYPEYQWQFYVGIGFYGRSGSKELVR